MRFKSPGKKPVTAFLIAVIILSCSFFSGNGSENLSERTVYIKKHTSQIILLLEQSFKLADSSLVGINSGKLKANYFAARRHYKHIECFIEYCASFDVKYFINGPLVKKSDLEIGKRIVDPHGFQVIEEQLFGKDTVDPNTLLGELKLLSDAFKAFEARLPDITVNDSQVLEMMQFELIRIGSLSLNGADATYTKTNSTECVHVLQGFEDLLGILKNTYPQDKYPVETQNSLIARLKLTEAYCLKHKNNEAFDRLLFITQYLKPLYVQLVKLHREPLFPFTRVNYAVNLSNDKLFEKENYNLDYFSVKASESGTNSLQAQLGELLFFDPVLSGNNQRACASCHKPDKAFSDGLQKGSGFMNDQVLERNTPSLLNTIFQKHFFYDGRARQLEQQANDVLHNQKEMNSSIEEMISKLNLSKEYRQLFEGAYHGTVDTTISYYGILKSIAEYEKTLVSMNSRFDKYIKGDYKQLNAHEVKGYNLFSGKALCGSCHFFPLFTSLVPPVYNDTEYEVIGVPENINSKSIDKDEGRMAVSKVPIHRFAFKTPTVRNSNLTAPYMHNGIYNTLEEVIEFYNKGGGQGLGIDIPHQTLPFDSLGLNKQEMADIKAFIISLTDTAGFSRKPKRLPEFEEHTLNQRIIGGSY